MSWDQSLFLGDDSSLWNAVQLLSVCSALRVIMFIFTTTILQKLKNKNPTLENPSAKVKSTSDQWHGLKMCKHGWQRAFKAEIVSVGWELDYGTILFIPAFPELKASGSFPTLNASHPIVTQLHATDALSIMVYRWGGQPQWWMGWKFCDGRTNTLPNITDAHDQNKKKLWKFKKKYFRLMYFFCLWSPRVCSSWQAGELGRSERLVPLGHCRCTWRRAAEGLGWPSLQWMLKKIFHLALDWVTQKFAIASFFQTKHLSLSY